MKKFPILYKLTSKEQIQQWQIVSDKNTFYTIEGIKDGKLTQSLPTICTAKNIGKVNETTPEQQAELEAKAKHQKKLDAGYAEVLGKGIKLYSPMLAFELEIDSLTFENRRVFIQPKLDGIRAISKNNKLFSRNGKIFTSCPHLHQDLTILDGELYNHEFKDNFNQIVSFVKKKIITEEEDQFAEHIQFWVYDFPECKDVFSQRYEELKKWYRLNKTKYIKLVPTYEVFNLQELENKHAEFISEGFEGSIIRLDLGPYEHKRSKQLLKYKEWQDKEFEILDVIEGEGNRTGTAGKFVLSLDKEKKIEFESNIKGEFSYLTKLLQEKKNLIGKLATVKFFNYTPAGVPRFPYVIKIDRQGYE